MPAHAPVCLKCGKNTFTATTTHITGVGAMTLVHCFDCGAVIGVTNGNVSEIDHNIVLLISLVRDLTQQLGKVVHY